MNGLWRRLKRLWSITKLVEKMEGSWHIRDMTLPGVFLCGVPIPKDAPEVPHAEVSDEETCPECQRVEALIQRHVDRVSQEEENL